LLYPTKFDSTAQHIKDDDIIVATFNTVSTVPNVDFMGATFALKTKDTIADLGATQTFIMEGTPVINKRITHFPLKVLLANVREALSTHERDVHIVGLLTVLTGHTIPNYPLLPYLASEF
jgi:hypothetical protein